MKIHTITSGRTGSAPLLPVTTLGRKLTVYTGSMRTNTYLSLLILTLTHSACSSVPKGYTVYSEGDSGEANGPWELFPGVLLSQADLTPDSPRGLLSMEVVKAMSDALLRLDGATSCDTTDPALRKPIARVSAEYCSAVYVVDTAPDGKPPCYELRLTTPWRDMLNPEQRCTPPRAVVDRDFPNEKTTLIGYIHNHPCGSIPSSRDLVTWPLEFDFSGGMAQLDLIPGNGITGVASVVEGTPLVAQSYIFIRRGDHSIYLLIRTTGDVHQWDGKSWEWRAKCRPSLTRYKSAPASCDPPLKRIGD